MAIKTNNEKTEPKVPVDLRKVLSGPKIMAMWRDLTPLARMDFVLWIDQAKQPETRKRRIETLGSRLTAGKRRPCCFAVVPMKLYKALGSDIKAKGEWRRLSALEKRAFISWINASKDSGSNGLRIEKAITMLKSGKKI